MKKKILKAMKDVCLFVFVTATIWFSIIMTSMVNYELFFYIGVLGDIEWEIFYKEPLSTLMYVVSIEGAYMAARLIAKKIILDVKELKKLMNN